jgi:hypothetical protein
LLPALLNPNRQISQEETIAEFLARTGAVESPPQSRSNGSALPFTILGFAIGCVLAWFVSGVPIYYHRRRRSAG